MPEVTIRLASVSGSEAALGWADGHTIVVDRPEGRAGGMGLGFNGAQMLALAIGGCFCNDLRYIAHRRGIAIRDIAVEVTLALAGEPVMATGARMAVRCALADGADPADLVTEAQRTSMVSNSLSRGIPVDLAPVS